MATEIFTGDTKTIKATFTSKVAEGAPTGSLIDPDGSLVTVTVYDADEQIVETDEAVRESLGVYVFMWVAPLVAGTYWVEFKGIISGNPELTRRKYSVKFKGDQ